MRSRSACPAPLREVPFLEAFADFSGASVTRFAMVGIYRLLFCHKPKMLAGTWVVCAPNRERAYFAALVSDCILSLLIFRTMPALRSATSLTLYSAADPRTC